MERMWIYHRYGQPVVIKKENYHHHEDNGWYESPIPFVKITDFGINPNDSMSVQALADSINGVCDYLNGQLNLDCMSKQELIDYADRHFDKKLPMKMRRETMIKRICRLLEAKKVSKLH